MRTIATTVAVFLWAGTAGAHELRCVDTVNGGALVEVTGYPTTLSYVLVVANVVPNADSVVLGASDTRDVCSPSGFQVPFTLGVGASEQHSHDIVVNSYAECRAMAEQDGRPDDFIDNVFTVTWDSGRQTCASRVLCLPPTPARGPTRQAGFWQNHVSAVQQCVDAGAVDLGFAQIATAADAMGLLWASAASFPDGSARGGADLARLLLARQTLAGECNVRLLGTAPAAATLPGDALAAMCGPYPGLMDSMQVQWAAFNASGEALALPAGFDPGAASPSQSQSLAADPTRPGQACAP